MTTVGPAISSLANGTIFTETTVEARGVLFNALTPAQGSSVTVYVHVPGVPPGPESTRATVYEDEFLTIELPQPLTTDVNGQIAGYVAPGQLLDAVASGGPLAAEQALSLNTAASPNLLGDASGAAVDNVVSTVLGGLTPVVATSYAGHPSTGTWSSGQGTIDAAGTAWACTASGTPGTWMSGPSLATIAGQIAAAAAGALQPANNLSDIANDSAARTNLGLGSAAVAATSAFEGAGAAAAAVSVETARAQTAETAAEQLAHKNQPSGYAGLDSSGLVASSALPSLAITDTHVVASQAAMLAIVGAHQGSVAVRTDGSGSTYICGPGDPTVLATWVLLPSPNAVTSVNAQLGAVNLTAATVGADASGAAAAAQTAAQASSAQRAANLSDLASVPTARTNLGLGSAATTASSAYDAAGAATTAQAASAQRAANLSDLPSAATARTNLGLGTAATAASSAFDAAGAATGAQAASAQKSANLSDLASAPTARTNLGLGSAATQASTAFDTAGAATAAGAAAIAASDAAGAAATAQAASLQKSGNLSDLANAGTARTNLGLGTAATQASAAFDAAGVATTAVTAHTAAVDPHADRAYADTSKLAKSTNLSDLASASTARTNLGLGTAATQATGAFDAAGQAASAQAAAIAASDASGSAAAVTAASAQKAANLSDLANAGTARTNLGLGTAATQATSAFDAAGTATTAVSTEATSRATADALLVPLTQKGAPSGVGSLDSGSHQTLSEVPAAVGNGTLLGFLRTSVTPDGTTDNTAALIADHTSAVAANFGELYLPRTSAPYVVERNGVVQRGGVTVRKGLNVRGDQTALLVNDNSAAFWAASTDVANTSATYITANVAAGDTNLTVSTSTGLTVGADVLCRLGQSTYDANESYNWMLCKIAAVPDSTHVTLDSPVTQPITVAGMTNRNIDITPITELLDGNTYEGFTIAGVQSAHPIGGFRFWACKNQSIRDCFGTQVGTGLIYATYVDNLRVDNWGVDLCDDWSTPGNHNAGRAVELDNVRNALFTNGRLRDCQVQFISMEEYCRNVRFQGLHIHVGRTDRTVSALFVAGTQCEFSVEDLLVTGIGTQLISSATPIYPRFRNVTFDTSTPPQINDLGVLEGRLNLNGTRYQETKTYSVGINLSQSMSSTFNLPNGLVRRCRVYASSTTGLTFLNFSCSVGSGTGDIHASLSSGATVALTNYGIIAYDSTTGNNRVNDKKVVIITDATVPAGAYLKIELDMFTVATDDGAAGSIDYFVNPVTSTATPTGVMGDGSDGAVTLDGTTTYTNVMVLSGGNTYTLFADLHASSITVNSGITLIYAGCRVFCTGAYVNNGTIGVAGNAGTAAGVGGAAGASNTIGSGGTGGAGATGAGVAASQATFGAGGAGGSGSSGAGTAGATALVGSTSVAAKARFGNPNVAAAGIYAYGGTSRIINGGCGGSGGTGDGTNKGGGGGAGGAADYSWAKTFVNNGTIICTGGAGGTPTTGNCGGGGGAGGGNFTVYTYAAATMGTVNVAGGIGGSGVGTGAAGANGSAGLSLNIVLPSV